MKIQDRIRAAFKPGEYELHYGDLIERVFPESEYPKAWRKSQNGRPPACAMALGKALRLMKLHDLYEEGRRYVPRPRPVG